MFENIIKFFKKIGKNETKEPNSKDKAKERLHLVLMQDRANVSADFLEMMKQEIIEVIKKYIEVEEDSIDVRLTNELKEDGTTGAPSLYANIPILHIKNEMKKEVQIKKENLDKDKEEKNNEEKSEETSEKKEEKSEEVKTEEKTEKNEDNQEEQKEEKKNEKVEVEKVQEKDNEKKDEDKKEKTKEDVKSGERQENKNTKNSNQKNNKNKK